MNGVSGLFCASLSRSGERRTVTPDYTFRAEGDIDACACTHKSLILYAWTYSSLKARRRLFYAPLASENVCTENLTPFLKLLPCKSQSGIAMLLNPHRIFDADWHGMSVRVIRRGGDTLELTMSVSAVFDPIRLEFKHIIRGKSPFLLLVRPNAEIQPKTGRFVASLTVSSVAHALHPPRALSTCIFHTGILSNSHLLRAKL